LNKSGFLELIVETHTACPAYGPERITRDDRASARRDIENWIKSYNERRLQSALGYRPPTETRRAWQAHMSAAA